MTIIRYNITITNRQVLLTYNTISQTVYFYNGPWSKYVVLSKNRLAWQDTGTNPGSLLQ